MTANGDVAVGEHETEQTVVNGRESGFEFVMFSRR